MTVIMKSILLVMMIMTSACSTTAHQQQEDRDRKAANINVKLGTRYLNQGKLELANIKLERALRQDPQLPMAHWSYGLLQMRLGSAEMAEKHFREAIALDPKDSRARNNYGIFLCDQGRLEEADDQFMRAVENPLYSYPESAYTNAGVCAQKGANPVLAESHFRNALKANKQYVPALLQMVKLSYERGHYLQSRAFVQRLEQTARHNPETLWLSYQIERQLGNQGGADNYGAKLKTQFPESKETALLLELERNGR